MRIWIRLLTTVTLILCVLNMRDLWAEQSLHEKVDRLIEAAADGPLNPAADDATFMRRVHLDFAGRIPTTEEARQFLDDESPDKRRRLIEQLLSGPDYPRHMQQFFHVMLMERRGENEAWQTYLRDAFETNKPWDQIAKEVLNPNANDEATRASAFFYTKRLEKYGQNPIDYPGLVRDVGRLMLGVDVQCAECHDHLFIDDYKQSSYQGLYAFLGNTVIRTDVKFSAVAEKPLLTKVAFKSVFDMEEMTTGPRLLGQPEVDVPMFKKGEEFIKPPDRKHQVSGETQVQYA